MEIIFDARDDRFELESLLDRLPKPLRPRAALVLDDLERKHLALLNRRRVALEKLAGRAEQTYEQVLRRLRNLDDHFGFIRTHLFWVRDEEILGFTTLDIARRELILFVRAAYHVAEELADASAWGRFSPEFLSAVFGLVVLPWPLRRARRALRCRLGTQAADTGELRNDPGTFSEVGDG